MAVAGVQIRNYYIALIEKFFDKKIKSLNQSVDEDQTVIAYAKKHGIIAEAQRLHAIRKEIRALHEKEEKLNVERDALREKINPVVNSDGYWRYAEDQMVANAKQEAQGASTLEQQRKDLVTQIQLARKVEDIIDLVTPILGAGNKAIVVSTRKKKAA